MENRSVIIRTKELIKGLLVFGIFFCFFAVGEILVYFSSDEISRGIYIIIAVVLGGAGIFILGYARELKQRVKKLLEQYPSE